MHGFDSCNSHVRFEWPCQSLTLHTTGRTVGDMWNRSASALAYRTSCAIIRPATVMRPQREIARLRRAPTGNTESRSGGPCATRRRETPTHSPVNQRNDLDGRKCCRSSATDRSETSARRSHHRRKARHVRQELRDIRHGDITHEDALGGDRASPPCRQTGRAPDITDSTMETPMWIPPWRRSPARASH